MEVIFEYDAMTLAVVALFMGLAGFVDAIAGGGGLVSLPGMFIVGLPSHLALATNKFGAMCGTGYTAYRYYKLGYINIRRSLIYAVMVMMGASLGTTVVLMISDYYLKVALLVILPATAFFLLRKKSLDNVETCTKVNTRAVLLCMLCTFCIGIYDGMYGPGSGTFLIIAYVCVVKLSIRRANGTCKFVNFISDVASFVIFAINGQFVLALALTASVANVAGNYLGARFFEKHGAMATRPIMLFVVLLFMIKIISELASD